MGAAPSIDLDQLYTDLLSCRDRIDRLAQNAYRLSHGIDDCGLGSATDSVNEVLDKLAILAFAQYRAERQATR